MRITTAVGPARYARSTLVCASNEFDHAWNKSQKKRATRVKKTTMVKANII